MLGRTNQNPLPQIILRVPGPWKGVGELAGRLPTGFRINGERFHVPGGGRLLFQALAVDKEFPRMFRRVCRHCPRSAELRGLDSYAMCALVSGPCASAPAAQRMLQTGASLIRAGGVGVFVKNSLMAHGASDWIELAEDRKDPSTLFFAFVGLIRCAGELFSHGMQLLGQRDGIADYGPEVPAPPPLAEFLHAVCTGEYEPWEGESFWDEQGRRYCIRREADRKIYENHPVNNPYGRWRLQPAK